MKKITNGDAYAIMILAGEKMGLKPGFVDQANRQLRGEPVTPTMGAMMSKESSELNNRLRHDPEQMAKANAIVQDIVAEFGFKSAASSAGNEEAAGCSGAPGEARP